MGNAAAKNLAYYWFPVVLYAGLIFYLSSLAQPLPEGGLEFDKKDLVLHLLEYFVLSALLLRAFLSSAVKRPYLFSIVLSVLYGISDEIHQLFVIGRVFSAYDLIANVFGACLILLFLLYEKFAKSFKTKEAAVKP